MRKKTTITHSVLDLSLFWFGAGPIIKLFFYFAVSSDLVQLKYKLYNRRILRILRLRDSVIDHLSFYVVAGSCLVLKTWQKL